MRTRLQHGFLALLLAVTVASPSSAAADSEALAEALRFRAMFGLSTDPRLVAQLEADAGAHYAEHPVPLTPEEKRDLDQRQFVQEHKQGLMLFGLAHPEMWGGLWTDQKREGRLIVQVVGDAEPHLSAIASLAPEGAVLELRPVSRTIADLERLQTAIEADWRRIDSLGVSMYAVGLAVERNQVRVGLSSVTSEVMQWFASHYDSEGVFLEEIAAPGYTGCSNRTNCPGPPLRGGISGSFGCSLGFIANKGGPTHYIYTAGHCANNGSSWYHGTKPIGTMRDDSTYNGSTADAALIGPISSSDISRWVYSTSASVLVITSIQQYWEDAVGDRVCLSAKMASAIRCGTITATPVSIEIQPGIVISQQVRANYSWIGGDSGGAVLNGSKAMGIQSGYIQSDATYSQIGHVQARTGSYVNVTNCGNFC